MIMSFSIKGLCMELNDIQKKYIHIIPDYSLVGLLLNHSNDKVVSSSNKGILAHDIIYWMVDKNHFQKSELSSMSKELDRKSVV